MEPSGVIDHKYIPMRPINKGETLSGGKNAFPSGYRIN